MEYPKHMYDLNEEVTIVNDIAEYFNGAKGIIRDINVVGENTLYGVELTESTQGIPLANIDTLLYFLATELL